MLFGLPPKLILYFRKNPSYSSSLDATFFLLTTNLHNISLKKIWRKQKKSKVRYIVGDPQRQASPNPCDARYENKIHQVTHTQKSGRNLGRSQTSNLPNKFFFSSWSCSHAYGGGSQLRKSLLDGAKNFPSKIWQHITTVSFV